MMDGEPLSSSRPIGMSHLNRYAAAARPFSPLIITTSRYESPPQNQRDVFYETDSSSISDRIPQSETGPTQIHFSKWYQNGVSSHRSSSLSPKPTERTINLSYRPPTPQVQAPAPTHRGILKCQRPTSDTGTESPRVHFGERSFWDGVGAADQFNGNNTGSYNSISSPNIGDSFSRKTVRFADGKPATVSKTPRAPYGCTIRSNGSLAQGIYEWEPEESYLNNYRDLNKPPRPPKLRPGLNFPPSTAAPRIRYESGPQPFNDDSYANSESIYDHMIDGRPTDGSQVERIDSQRLDALVRPYLTSASQKVPPNPNSPTPAAMVTGNIPVFRSEVRHLPSAGGTYVMEQKNSRLLNESQPVPPAPDSPMSVSASAPSSVISVPLPQFSYSAKPTPAPPPPPPPPHRVREQRVSGDGDIDGVPSFLETDMEATLKPGDFSRIVNAIPIAVVPTTTPVSSTGTNGIKVVNRTPQTPLGMQQEQERKHRVKRHQTLKVETSSSSEKPPSHPNGSMMMSPLRGPPFTDGPRRRANGIGAIPTGPSYVNTGSLDRDGVWRPNRSTPSSATINGKPTLTTDPPASAFPFTNMAAGGLFGRTERRSMRHPVRTAPNGGSAGSYEVPIVVLSSSKSNSSSSAVPSIPPSPNLRQGALSPTSIGLRRGTNGGTMRRN